jgi:LmbE family N-acetylglucosaminyl deacetylase
MSEPSIEDLAEDVFEAEEHYKALGMRNTFHLDHNDRKKARIEYVLAENKLIAARQRIRERQGRR